MRRRSVAYTSLILVVFITIVSGCKFQPTMLPQPTITPVVSTEPAGTTATQPSDTTLPTDTCARSELPDEVFSLVNGVHATCENYDFTFYMNLSASTQPVIEFYLITEKPLPSDAAIQIPGVSAGYRAEILDRSPTTSAEFTRGLNKILYAYMADPDLDFATYLEEGIQVQEEYDRLFLLVYGEDGRQPGETYSPEHPYAESYEKAENAYFSYMNRYQEEYDAYIATQPLPEFHVYKVKLTFTAVPEKEKIKSVELIAGNMSREIPMANVWIEPRPNNLETKGVTFKARIEDPNTGFWLGENTFTNVENAVTYPFGSGVSSATLYFVANKDIVLDDLRSYGDNTRIQPEWAELAILSNMGAVVTAKWIPGTELLIRKGEQVAMCIYWTDPYTELFHYGSFQSFAVEYRCDEEQCRMVYGSSSFRDPGNVLYPCYLQIARGVDLGRYFKEYFSVESIVP